MKALVYTAPHSLVFQDEPDPVPQAGEVLVRVEAVGICGSDMHAYHGHDARRPAPLILGHEAAGRIVGGKLYLFRSAKDIPTAEAEPQTIARANQNWGKRQ